MKPLIWIIDEEWSDYQTETSILKDAFPDCEIRHSGNDYLKDLDDFGKDADAILCQVYIDMPKETIEKLTRCQIIAVYGGGYDRIAIDAAKEKAITVTFVPGYCVEDVSDYVIAAIYFFNKNLSYYFAAADKGPWGAQAAGRLNPRIQSSTLLIIGLGRIGRTVAQKALRMGMTVLACDPRIDAAAEAKQGIRQVSLDEGLALADFITIHTKYDENVHHLIAAEQFRQMKQSAHIINTSRGKVINEADLIEAVQAKTISGAMLDVISEEPPMGNEPIFHVPGIHVTPHVSYLSTESLETLKRRAAGNVVRILQGEKSEDAVF
ncbi:NAD(P)-dependent oxidoreductase [Sporolactobacillus spathodeae]|uniref:D-3-phosphoglycerate dehydrogenase n=1 Tax=Sporolactobacillus spathodeae TaxID=1465502 RepID=A0ABS2Q8L6_9BACL|nr:D-3-phosphoglycerate dehydrogenase [Sporolactobacillus spathodeae]